VRWLLLVFLLSKPVFAEVEGQTTFRSSHWSVTMNVPRGWVVTDEQTYPDVAYPGIIARAIYQQLAMITLAVENVDEKETTKAYTDRASDKLKLVGYTVSAPKPHQTGALTIEASPPDGRQFIRQAYLLHDKKMYILTMAFGSDLPTAIKQDLLRTAFESTLRGLVFQGSQ
jgi:hypothetical protein